MTWCVVMAGGVGSRFWPLSQTDNPKQFLDIMGTGNTMLQTTFRRCAELCPRENIVIVTGEQYVDHVHEQIGELEPYQVLGEPLRRGTAPCIAYAAAVIGDMDPEATLIVVPSDHAIFQEEKFKADLRQAVETVQRKPWIITLGVQPVNPNTTYGYIQRGQHPSLPEVRNLHPVTTFTEKPPVEMARQFIASGEFYWNAGIFVWTLPVLREAYKSYLPALWEVFFNVEAASLEGTLDTLYSQCETVSIDQGIMERASNVHVLTASFGWSDVETWESLYNVSSCDSRGNAVRGNAFTYDTRNCLIDIPSHATAVIDGLDGYIVAAANGILMICPRDREEMVFRFASDVELKELIDSK
ncbi:MAG: mannose-1-phosphate guanylyltransferase [Bacteroidales bacterium]|nr:mannose-1-phosphate guanylyltransferase [Bacteroidales bacterium]